VAVLLDWLVENDFVVYARDLFPFSLCGLIKVVRVFVEALM